MSDDGEDFEGEFDEEIVYEDEEVEESDEDKKSIKSSSDEEDTSIIGEDEDIDENADENADADENANENADVDENADDLKIEELKIEELKIENIKKEEIKKENKFKDTKKIKNNTVLPKSNTPRTIIVIAEHNKKTDNRLHRSELSNIISMRSAQIDTYGTHFASHPVDKKVDEIAIKELYERKCPLMLRRVVGYGLNGEIIAEIWDVNTMTLPPRHTI